MKRTLLMLLCALMLLSLAACKGGEPAEPDNTPAPTETALDTPAPALPTEAPVSEHVPDHSYNRETDFDKRLAMNGNFNSIIETEDVYYWLPDRDRFIRYCEKDGSDYGVLCGRPECVHDNGNAFGRSADKNCNGYIGSSRPYIWIVDDKLYYVDDYTYFRTYPDSCGVIMRMNLDGTGRELFKVIPKPETPYDDSMCPQYYCYHRGALYSFIMGNYVEDAEPSQPFVAGMFPLDGDEWTIFYDAGAGIHYGSVLPSGEFCYVVDQVWGGEDSTNRVLRWSSVTGELELLYEGFETGLIFRYWVDEEGDFYAPQLPQDGEGPIERILCLEDGKMIHAIDFEDPETVYTERSVAGGVVIARNYVPYDRSYYVKYGKETDIDIWIKRFDNTTVYKGKLPMGWLDSIENTPRFEGADLVSADENGMLCVFKMQRRSLEGSTDATSLALVKYVFTEEGGIEEILLGTTYMEIDNG